MKGLDPRRLSKRHRDAVTAAQRKPAVKFETAPTEPEYDSNTEARFAILLDLASRDPRPFVHTTPWGILERWRYHPCTFLLAPRKRYTPDFWVLTPDGRRLWFEVKGSWKSKNARDSRTRLEIAAHLFPEDEWWAATPDEGWWWEFERIRG